jgi:hypothetical protein
MRPREVPVTRAMVILWLVSWHQPLVDTPALRNHFKNPSRLGTALAATLVDNEGNDSLPPQSTILDLILLDIKSYA